MRRSIADHIPMLGSGPFQTVNSGNAVMAEIVSGLPADPPELTYEEKLAAEYERGRQAGAAVAQERYQTQLAEARQNQETALQELRAAHEQETAGLLKDALEGAFGALEQQIAASVAAVLQPLIEEQVIYRIVISFKAELARFLEGDDGALIRVSGPQNLLELLSSDLGALAGRIELQPAEAPELTANIGETSLETRLTDWMAQLAQVMETH